MSRLQKVTIILILMGFIPSAAQAADADSVYNSDLEQVLGQFKKNKHIIVHTVDDREIKGKIRFISNDSLFLKKRGKIKTVALADVHSVWIRKSSGTTPGAAIGGMTGLLIGASIGSELKGLSDWAGNDSGTGTGAMILSSVVGFAVGGALGAAIGSTIKKDELRYKRPDSNDYSMVDRLRLNVSPDFKGGVAVTASLSF